MRWIRKFNGETSDEEEDDPWLTDEEVENALSLAAKADYAEVTRHLDLYMGPGRLNFRGLPYAGMVANKGWWSALVPYTDAIVQYDTAESLITAPNRRHNVKTRPKPRTLSPFSASYPATSRPCGSTSPGFGGRCRRECASHPRHELYFIVKIILFRNFPLDMARRTCHADRFPRNLMRGAIMSKIPCRVPNRKHMQRHPVPC